MSMAGEKRLDGRGPLGLAMIAVKVCAAVIFYCPVFASAEKPSSHRRVRLRIIRLAINDACREQSGCFRRCRKCGTGFGLFELFV